MRPDLALRAFRAIAVAMAIASAVVPLTARADGEDAAGATFTARHCVWSGQGHWVLTQFFALQTNPEGGENTLRFGPCIPLIKKPGILFDYTSIEFGMLHQISPAFVQLGGYVQVTPLSFLQLRVEGSGLTYWALGLDRAGYYPVDGYDHTLDPHDEDFEGNLGTSETGWNVNFIAVLRLRIPLSEYWAVLALSLFNVSYYDIGNDAYYFNLRWDVILAGKDWLMGNELFAGVENKLTEALAFRYGFFDSYRRVPNAGYDGHQLGTFVMLNWPRPSLGVHDLSIFGRFGVYVAHDFRTESFSVLAGLMVQYDVGSI